MRGAAPATVKWELATIQPGFNLCVDPAELIPPSKVPTFKKLMPEVKNTRTGFVTEAELQPLLEALPEEHRGWVEFGFITGWRIKSEVLSREWRNVGFDNGWVRLEPHEAKNDVGREFPINDVPRLRAVLERRWKRKKRIEQEQNIVVRHVFTYDNGSQIKSPGRAWQMACRKAGLDGTIPHDLRRSAVRNLERAGIARSIAMDLVGHRTDSIYNRYSIKEEKRLREAGQKLAALHGAEPKPERRVAGKIP